MYRNRWMRWGLFKLFYFLFFIWNISWNINSNMVYSPGILWHVWREPCINLQTCIYTHCCTYMWSLPLSVFSQLRSQAVAAHCGAIVLMLIEYSTRSFHGCLLSHFIMVLYQNVHFFPLLISKSDLVLWWRLFSSLVYTSQTVYGMIMCLCHCYSRADNIFSLLCEGEFLANIQYISVTLGRLLLSWVFIMCICMHL